MSVRYSPIQLLSVALRNQIAAGEVVERPASAMKELVENGLDAGATQIDVELENGGRDVISVQDDGCGIPKEYLELAVTRHATSKIAQSEDLENITTFGFRGEALPSIAQVSRFSLQSACLGESNQLNVTFGEITSCTPSSLPKGTLVRVCDLFGNVPARLKFLKTPATEIKRAVDMLFRIALANCSVGFTFKSCGRTLLSFLPGETVPARLKAFWAPDLVDALVPFRFAEEGLTVHGFCAPPTCTQVRSSHMYFYVNGRAIQDRSLLGAVKEAYKGKLLSKEYPQCVLFLEIDPHRVDVNVHPAKTEVRFQDESEVFRACVRAIRSALGDEVGERAEGGAPSDTSSAHSPLQSQAKSSEQTAEHTAQLGSRPQTAGAHSPRHTDVSLWGQEEASAQEEGSGRGGGVSPSADAGAKKPPENYVSRPEGFWGNLDTLPVFSSKHDKEQGCLLPEELFSCTSQPETAVTGEASRAHSAGNPPSGAGGQEEERRGEGRDAAAGGTKTKEENFTVHVMGDRKVPGRLRYLGQVAATYLLFENDEQALVLIDQHAAHERILFERLQARAYAGASQLLMVPIELPIHPQEVERLWTLRETLEMMGYAYTVASDCLRVTAIPPMLSLADAREFLKQALVERVDDPSDLLKRMACRAAVKAGQVLSVEEVGLLMNEWFETKNRAFCPHGRPAVLIWDTTMLEKAFKRK